MGNIKSRLGQCLVFAGSALRKNKSPDKLALARPYGGTSTNLNNYIKMKKKSQHIATSQLLNTLYFFRKKTNYFFQNYG